MSSPNKAASYLRMVTFISSKKGERDVAEAATSACVPAVAIGGVGVAGVDSVPVAEFPKFAIDGGGGGGGGTTWPGLVVVNEGTDWSERKDGNDGSMFFKDLSAESTSVLAGFRSVDPLSL